AVSGGVAPGASRAGLHLRGVPAGLAGKARGSFAVAIHAGGPVKASASSAFVEGMRTGLLYAAGAALLAAIVVAVLLTGGRRSPRAARRDQPELAPATR